MYDTHFWSTRAFLLQKFDSGSIVQSRNTKGSQARSRGAANRSKPGGESSEDFATISQSKDNNARNPRDPEQNRKTEISVVPIYKDEKDRGGEGGEGGEDREPPPHPSDQGTPSAGQTDDGLGASFPSMDDPSDLPDIDAKLKRELLKKYRAFLDWREKNFILDGVYVSNLSVAYSKVNPKLQFALPPYNALLDKACHQYFTNIHVRRVMRRTMSQIPQKKGEAIEGYVIEKNFIKENRSGLLARRNRFGCGRHPITYKGHDWNFWLQDAHEVAKDDRRNDYESPDIDKLPSVGGYYEKCKEHCDCVVKVYYGEPLKSYGKYLKKYHLRPSNRVKRAMMKRPPKSLGMSRRKEPSRGRGSGYQRGRSYYRGSRPPRGSRMARGNLRPGRDQSRDQSASSFTSADGGSSSPYVGSQIIRTTTPGGSQFTGSQSRRTKTPSEAQVSGSKGAKYEYGEPKNSHAKAQPTSRSSPMSRARGQNSSGSSPMSGSRNQPAAGGSQAPKGQKQTKGQRQIEGRPPHDDRRESDIIEDVSSVNQPSLRQKGQKQARPGSRLSRPPGSSRQGSNQMHSFDGGEQSFDRASATEYEAEEFDPYEGEGEFEDEFSPSQRPNSQHPKYSHPSGTRRSHGEAEYEEPPDRGGGSQYSTRSGPPNRGGSLNGQNVGEGSQPPKGSRPPSQGGSQSQNLGEGSQLSRGSRPPSQIASQNQNQGSKVSGNVGEGSQISGGSRPQSRGGSQNQNVGDGSRVSGGSRPQSQGGSQSQNIGESSQISKGSKLSGSVGRESENQNESKPSRSSHEEQGEYNKTGPVNAQNAESRPQSSTVISSNSRPPSNLSKNGQNQEGSQVNQSRGSELEAGTFGATTDQRPTPIPASTDTKNQSRKQTSRTSSERLTIREKYDVETKSSVRSHKNTDGTVEQSVERLSKHPKVSEVISQNAYDDDDIEVIAKESFKGNSENQSDSGAKYKTIKKSTDRISVSSSVSRKKVPSKQSYGGKMQSMDGSEQQLEPMSGRSSAASSRLANKKGTAQSADVRGTKSKHSSALSLPDIDSAEGKRTGGSKSRGSSAMKKSSEKLPSVSQEKQTLSATGVSGTRSGTKNSTSISRENSQLSATPDGQRASSRAGSKDGSLYGGTTTKASIQLQNQTGSVSQGKSQQKTPSLGKSQGSFSRPGSQGGSRAQSRGGSRTPSEAISKSVAGSRAKSQAGSRARSQAGSRPQSQGVSQGGPTALSGSRAISRPSSQGGSECQSEQLSGSQHPSQHLSGSQHSNQQLSGSHHSSEQLFESQHPSQQMSGSHHSSQLSGSQHPSQQLQLSGSHHSSQLSGSHEPSHAQSPAASHMESNEPCSEAEDPNNVGSQPGEGSRFQSQTPASQALSQNQQLSGPASKSNVNSEFTGGRNSSHPSNKTDSRSRVPTIQTSHVSPSESATKSTSMDQRPQSSHPGQTTASISKSKVDSQVSGVSQHSQIEEVDEDQSKPSTGGPTQQMSLSQGQEGSATPNATSASQSQGSMQKLSGAGSKGQEGATPSDVSSPIGPGRGTKPQSVSASQSGQQSTLGSLEGPDNENAADKSANDGETTMLSTRGAHAGASFQESGEPPEEEESVGDNEAPAGVAGSEMEVGDEAEPGDVTTEVGDSDAPSDYSDGAEKETLDEDEESTVTFSDEENGVKKKKGNT